MGYYVIGGFEGTALTRLYFDNPTEAVEAVRISVPKAGDDIRIIAAMQTGTILVFDDPGDRVKVVYDSYGPIGVVGARSARLIRTDPSCHLQMWKPISPKNPDPNSFYSSVTKRSPISVISDYSVGLVDLETEQNDNRRRFPDAKEIDLSGPAADLWAHFARFNPGGLVSVLPSRVKHASELSSHPVLPQYAGLARYVEESALTPRPRSGRMDRAKGSALKVSIGGRTFRPGGGDDAILVEGLVYR